MVNLDSRGGLAVAEVAFFGPAFLVGIAVCIKQGFGKSSGWLYLVILSVLRLIGSSTTLYMETHNDHSSGLQETAVITSFIGTAPLLLVLLGMLERIHAAMEREALSPNIFRPIHLLALLGLILGIVGGVKESSSDSNSYDAGRDCRKAGTIIFLAMYIAEALLTILTARHKSYIAKADSKLIIAGCAVLPFLLVRIVYSVAVSFGGPGSAFYFGNVNIWISAFMMFAMEAVCVTIYSAAGLSTPRAVNFNDVERDARPISAADGRFNS